MINKFVDTAYAIKTGVEVNGKTNFANFDSYINAAFNWFVKVGFVLCVLMYVYAGVRYILSQGNQTAINDAKDLIINTTIGLAILIMVFFLLKILGVDS